MKQPLTTQCLAVERSKRREGRVFVVRRTTFATVSAAALLSDACTTLLGSACVLKRTADIAQSRQTLTRRSLSLTDISLQFSSCILSELWLLQFSKFTTVIKQHFRTIYCFKHAHPFNLLCKCLVHMSESAKP
jgi:hypothetical protein